MNKTITLPENWTGDQAWAALELLYHLENLIFDTYEEQLLKTVSSNPDPPECDFETDTSDDIPY
jgi:hypothetical protein